MRALFDPVNRRRDDTSVTEERYAVIGLFRGDVVSQAIVATEVSLETAGGSRGVATPAQAVAAQDEQVSVEGANPVLAGKGEEPFQAEIQIQWEIQKTGARPVF